MKENSYNSGGGRGFLLQQREQEDSYTTSWVSALFKSISGLIWVKICFSFSNLDFKSETFTFYTGLFYRLNYVLWFTLGFISYSYSMVVTLFCFMNKFLFYFYFVNYN